MNQPYVFTNGAFTWHVMISPDYPDPLRHPTAEEARELDRYFASPEAWKSDGVLWEIGDIESIDGGVALIPIDSAGESDRAASTA